MVTCGTIEKIDEGSCRLIIGADTPQSLAFLPSVLEIDFEVESSTELAAALHAVVERFQRAARAGTHDVTQPSVNVNY